MLNHNDRPFFTRLQILGQKKNSPVKHIRPDIVDDLIAGPFWAVVNFSTARIGRHHGITDFAYDVFREDFPIHLCRFRKPVSGVVGHLLQKELAPFVG